MDKEYTERLRKIENEIERWLPFETSREWAINVFSEFGKKVDMGSTNNLLAPLEELIFRGGKRWRPLLMTLICETLNGGDMSIPLSPVVELSHNASLIHDDIEDESDERRGKPSIHRMYGVDVAVNAGSFLYFLASACIEASNFERKDFIYKSWMECMRRLHLGQSMDISWHRNITIVPSMDEYNLMCAMKTGSLARLSAELGAFAAGAPEDVIKLLGDVTDKMGIGFQILDDVKNLTTGVQGKRRGDDVVEGKKSLPILLYMNKYPEKRNKIFYYFHVAKTNGYCAPEVEELIETLTNSDVFEEASEIGRKLLRETKEIFHSHEFGKVNINNDAHALLDGFIKLIS
ncbi:MAG: polyprenyl synthetase family protein [Treponema sp.]|nr:polyprenyl synthetase family protein [Treponema sp.]